MKRDWNTKTFVAIGTLAALQVVLNLPGAFAAQVIGMPVVADILSVVVIGVMYPLVPLIIRRFGAATLWMTIVAVLALPLPIAAPAGFLPKIPYLIAWGFLADLTFWLFRRSDKLASIVTSVVQVGLGGPIAVFLWTYLGAPQLAADLAKFVGWVSIIVASLLGAGLGFLAYYIYGKIKNTAAIQRLQQ